MRGSALDLVLIVFAVVFAYVGYRRGFVLGILSFGGFIAGALLGLQLSPPVLDRIHAPGSRLIAAVSIVLGLAFLGQLGAFYLGSKLREYVRSPSARIADGVGGGFISVVAMLLVAWMMAAPLASSPEAWLASQVRRSAVITEIDRTVPDPVRNMYGSFSDAVNDSAFPEIFSGLAPTRVAPAAPPDPQLARSPAVLTAHDSVVRISGDADECHRRSTGSGFMYAPERVMTNAHVVAGTTDINVQLYGERYDATVVVFDPARDVAILRVPELDAPEMTFVDNAADGSDAIVVGYPLNGPYTAVAARIRQHQEIRGPDIYSENTVSRDVYAIRSQVRPGNSGGPLISASGRVLGVIFAAAADDPDTGFALSAREVSPVAEQGRSATRAVSTGPCHS